MQHSRRRMWHGLPLGAVMLALLTAHVVTVACDSGDAASTLYNATAGNLNGSSEMAPAARVWRCECRSGKNNIIFHDMRCDDMDYDISGAPLTEKPSGHPCEGNSYTIMGGSGEKEDPVGRDVGVECYNRYAEQPAFSGKLKNCRDVYVGPS